MDPVATIPIFPLASVVLFPKLRVPLYIFEPRYRQMIEAALSGDRRVGMAVVAPESQPRTLEQQEREQRRIEGDPEVFDIGCQGTIEDVRRRPDGTFDLVLLGDRRFRIKRELPRSAETLYRQCEVEYLTDEEDDLEQEELTRLRAEVQLAFRNFLQRHTPQHLQQFESGQFRELPHDVWTNTLSLSLPCDVVEKQSLLEADRISARLHGLLTILEFLSAGGANPGSSEPDIIQ